MLLHWPFLKLSTLCILLVPPDLVRTHWGSHRDGTYQSTRAPSGPVKVSVPTQPQERPHGGISLTSGVAALLAWFPASWASKVVPCFLAQGGTAASAGSDNTLPHSRSSRVERDQRARTLQAVRFVETRGPQELTSGSMKTIKPPNASLKSFVVIGLVS